MASLAQIVQFLHPTSTTPADWIIKNQRGTESVTFWNTGTLGAQPSLETLLASSGDADADPAPGPVPPAIGPFQIRAGLIAAGVAADSAALDTVINNAIDTGVADAGQNALAKLAWAKASEFRRDAPFLEVVRVVLGKTHAEVDEIFRNGNTF